MAGFLPLDRRAIIGGLIFVLFIWTLSSFTQPANYFPGSKSASKSGDRLDKIPQPKVDLPPWYDDGEDRPPGPPKAVGGDRPKAPPPPPPPPNPDEHRGPTKSSRPPPAKGAGAGGGSGPAAPPRPPSNPGSRPLILYAYAESEAARENLDFFVRQGLHGGADFVFVLSGETSAASLIPMDKANVRVVTRPANTCSDLGALGEVLRKDDLWKKYKRFITLSASIRGPFLPYYSRQCWSDLYLDRVTDRVKLVGMTGNCWPRFHVQSMIWATDAKGMELLLHPPPSASPKDEFGNAGDAVALAGCYDGWSKAQHAEVGATDAVVGAGFDVDLMMMAYHGERRYAARCNASAGGDVLWRGHYFGATVHPYETVFVPTGRDIDPPLIERLTAWHSEAGVTSWDTCGAA